MLLEVDAAKAALETSLQRENTGHQARIEQAMASRTQIGALEGQLLESQARQATLEQQLLAKVQLAKGLSSQLEVVTAEVHALQKNQAQTAEAQASTTLYYQNLSEQLRALSEQHAEVTASYEETSSILVNTEHTVRKLTEKCSRLQIELLALQSPEVLVLEGKVL